MRRRKNRIPESPEIPEIDIIDLDNDFMDAPTDVPDPYEDNFDYDFEEIFSEEQEPEEYEAEVQEAGEYICEKQTPKEGLSEEPEVLEPDGEISEEDTQSKDVWIPAVNRIWPFILIIIILLAGITALLLYIYDPGIFPIPSESAGTSSESASASDDPETVPVEILDIMYPAPEAAAGSTADDGRTVIVAFGNSPLADARGASDSLAGLIEDMTDATVYNCSVGSSYLCAGSQVLSSQLTPADAFNFYWLTASVCQRNNRYVYRDIFETLGDDAPSDGRDAYDTLQSIDFATVDVITLMYDAADYLAGHRAAGTADEPDIRLFTDNMRAGIRLIQQTYPHIRIIVMSPAYAYASDSEGNRQDSAEYSYGTDTLTDFVTAAYDVAESCGVTFVDNYNGTVTVSNASEYLEDHVHLNAAGRKAFAERFAAALHYFDKNE